MSEPQIIFTTNLTADFDDSDRPNIKPVTYNMGKETITLLGNPKVIKFFKEGLQWAVNQIPKRGRSKNSVAKQSNPYAVSGSSPQAYRNDVPRIQGSDNEEPPAKVFAIKPKDNQLLVQIWMKSILPVLPGILSPGVGGTYAASLVRRGPSDFAAEPCVQIESPCIPGPENRAIIADSLNKIWNENGQDAIQLKFTKGHLSKLFNGLESDTEIEESVQQRFHFNLNRPLTKPGMGASLGLICSEKVSGTLGGYILINGEKFILTSDHFVEQSQDTKINTGVMPGDKKTLVSPSLFDRARITECLEQTERDIKAKKKSQWLEHVGDRDIQPSEPDDAISFPRSIGDIEELLEQVKRPHAEFSLGEVFRRSKEPRKSLDAQVLGEIGYDYMRQMDWAICKVNNDRAGENRPKYRSNEEARADHYIHESNRADEPGDICHETCDIDPGSQVYYVGQKSGRRDGTVNGVPDQISVNDVTFHEWAMLGSQGKHIQKKSVEGDSGAWVIRKYDNKLMGQITSYYSGRLIFTTIKDIFADIQELYAHVVSLPTIERTANAAIIPIPAEPLCSVGTKSVSQVAQPYSWLLEPKMKAANISLPNDTEVFTSAASSTALADTPRETEDDLDYIFSNPRSDSCSSLPSLKAAPASLVPMFPWTPPASPVPKSPVTPQAFGTPNASDNQLDKKEPCTKPGEPEAVLIEDIGDHERPRSSEPITLGYTDFEIVGHYSGKKNPNDSISHSHFPPKRRNAMVSHSHCLFLVLRNSLKLGEIIDALVRCEKLGLHQILPIESAGSKSTICS